MFAHWTSRSDFNRRLATPAAHPIRRSSPARASRNDQAVGLADNGHDADALSPRADNAS